MFNIGDKVVAVGNWEDEQLGEFAYMGEQVITEIASRMAVFGEPEFEIGTKHQLVKTDHTNGEWVDSAWFRRTLAKHEV